MRLYKKSFLSSIVFFLCCHPFLAQEDCAHLVVNKPALTITYFDGSGKAVATYAIACGDHYGNKQERGDRKTPEGTFRINQILNSTGISHDFGDGNGPVPNAYGPWFFRLDVPGFHDIGIHGTHLPESIGSRTTEGCIRMRNEDIIKLKPLVYLGMPVIVLPDKETIEDNLMEIVVEDDDGVGVLSGTPADPSIRWFLIGALICLLAVLVITIRKIRKGE